MQNKLQKAIYVAALSISLLLPTWAKAEVNISAAGFGDVIRAIHEWYNSEPTPTQARATVAKLSTELAVLAGLNSSLADAMLSNGPFNVSWMYSSLEKIKQENQKVFGMINGVDPNFGEKNTKLMADLSARMNEKVGLLDPGGNKVDLSQETVRKQFGEVLRTESNILLGLSNQISTALSTTN
jgi:hypothetical protein